MQAQQCRLCHLLFDLDETLYPSSSTLGAEISRRMTVFVCKYLGKSVEEAAAVRRDLSARYGTTLAGLIAEHGLVDTEGYLEFCHPADVQRYLQPDPSLGAALSALTLPKSILTNSPREHAERILAFLGIRSHFLRIYDIRFSGLRGKPHEQTYRDVLADLDCAATEVLFIDNRRDYLEGFQALGGQVLLLDDRRPAGGRGAERLPRISAVRELPAYLQGRGLL
jgi:putative hydrolase of the HAD superfamily